MYSVLATAKHQTVLVIEDDAATRYLNARVVKALGARVIEAANGVEAIEVLSRETFTPDLVLTDVSMPLMDGVQFVRWFRDRAVYNRTPVIVVSGSVVRGQQIQGDFLLRKPVNVERMRAMVTSSLRGRGGSVRRAG